MTTSMPLTNFASAMNCVSISEINIIENLLLINNRCEAYDNTKIFVIKN